MSCGVIHSLKVSETALLWLDHKLHEIDTVVLASNLHFIFGTVPFTEPGLLFFCWHRVCDLTAAVSVSNCCSTVTGSLLWQWPGATQVAAWWEFHSGRHWLCRAFN